jgi:signal transduction histidine kinase
MRAHDGDGRFGEMALPDLALALALLVTKLATLATGAQPGPAFAYLAAPFWTLPLAWRRRFPVAVAVIIATTDAVEVVASGYRNSFVALFALLIVLYSLGAHASVRGIGVSIVALVAATAVDQSAQQAPTTFSGWVSDIAGLVAAFLVPLAVGIAMRQQRLRVQALERERDERARAAVAEERTRIARELHDEVAHAMSVIAVQADAAEGALARDPALVQRPLVAIRDTARDALADMRRVVGALRDSDAAVLAPEPGLARIGALVEQARAGGLQVDVRVEGDPVPLPPTLDLAAYRVVQEGLTNVRKHAAATRAEIAIRYEPDRISIAVDDDGDGSGVGGGTGRGLAGVRERVSVLRGEFVAGPHPRGFALRVTLPLT